MSKYSKYSSWVDREFSRKIALEYHKRHWKWRKARGKKRPYVWQTAYAWALRRKGSFERLKKFKKSQEKQKKILEDIKNGNFPDKSWPGFCGTDKSILSEIALYKQNQKLHIV